VVFKGLTGETEEPGDGDVFIHVRPMEGFAIA